MTDAAIIDEKVKIWVFFDPSTGLGQAAILPIAMSWRRRLIKFKGLIFKSTRKIGSTRIINLVCQAEGSNFELEFNTESYLWKVKKVMSDE